MAEVDWFTKLIQDFGPLQSREAVSPSDRARYLGRAPSGLIQFWKEQGRGNVGGTETWICDPAIFAPLIDFIFRDDPNFHPGDLTAIYYDAFGYVGLWHRTKRLVTLGLTMSDVIWVGAKLDEASGAYSPPDFKDNRTGVFMSEDFMAGRAMYPHPPPNYCDPDGEDLFPRAVEALGALKAGEIYGVFPAMQLGGDMRLENLRKVDAVVYGMIAAQAEPFTLMALTAPKPPDYPFGHTVRVRPIGKR